MKTLSIQYLSENDNLDGVVKKMNSNLQSLSKNVDRSSSAGVFKVVTASSSSEAVTAGSYKGVHISLETPPGYVYAGTTDITWTGTNKSWLFVWGVEYTEADSDLLVKLRNTYTNNATAQVTAKVLFVRDDFM